jgi:transcriptional regulator GlxA family with amidase domain
MHDFSILVLDGAYASSVSLTLDILTAAQRLAPLIGSPVPRWRVFSAQEGGVQLSNGLSLQAPPLPRRARADGSVWIVPGLGLDDAVAVALRFERPDVAPALAALRAQSRAGGTVAASCSAVFLLHAAGLLDGRRVTTSWWMSRALKRLATNTVVDAGRMVIHDGPIVTSGAALAQTDLMLHLLRMRFGAELPQAVSRVLLIDERAAQAPYVTPSLMSNGNAMIAQLQARIEQSLPEPPSIGRLAAELGISERTLARHVRAATGHTPMALVQHVRLTRARNLLENSRRSVEEVAAEVGYGDATALRRLMRKRLGATPRQLRRQVHQP